MQMWLSPELSVALVIYLKGWSKRQLLVSTILSLCLLVSVISAINGSVVNAYSESARSLCYDRSCVLSPVQSIVDDNTSRSKRVEFYRKAYSISRNIACPYIINNLKPSTTSFLGNFNHLVNFYSLRPQQASQLSDIPPPSYPVS